MTLEEYTAEVRKNFPVGAKSKADVDAFFKEKETLDYIRDGYNDRSMAEASPKAVANCLDMLY